MAGTVTATYDKGLNGQYTFNSAAANGANFAVGTIGLGTYTSGGMTFALDFNNTDFVMVGPASDVVFKYDYTNEALLIMTVSQTGAGLVELASDVDCTSFTAVQFMAVGH